MNAKKGLRVLVIEDDKIENLKFGRVVANLDVLHQVTFVNDGDEAIDLLMSKDTTLPQLIVLDLNMPRLDGFEFLKMLKSTEYLKYIPVVILTTSENKKEIKTCYELGIAGYLVKPLDYNIYVSKIESLLKYWSLNELLSS